ncbi:hypothetical protein RRG08_005885 [Elysia crispata]|uniref:Uncharacterized protein n=1 Tax=Elysia crispata TaxID=231223 RepID=A0AAE1EEA3_9GAST|nr:hypothetical protein RRG08_005885 [Elysia crispata]
MECLCGYTRCSQWSVSMAIPAVLFGVSLWLYPLFLMECLCGYTRCSQWSVSVAIPAVLNGVSLWLYPLFSMECLCGYTLVVIEMVG